MLSDWCLRFLNIFLKNVIRKFQTVLGVFSQMLSGTSQKNKVVAYLATIMLKVRVENVEDEKCYNFILLKCLTINKEF